MPAMLLFSRAWPALRCNLICVLPRRSLWYAAFYFRQGAPFILKVALNGKPVRSSRAIPALPPQR